MLTPAPSCHPQISLSRAKHLLFFSALYYYRCDKKMSKNLSLSFFCVWLTPLFLIDPLHIIPKELSRPIYLRPSAYYTEEALHTNTPELATVCSYLNVYK